MVPELKLNFGYQVTQNIRAFIGYDLLYVSSMARLGNNMDRNVNTQIPSVLGFTPVHQRFIQRSIFPIRASGHRESMSEWKCGLRNA